MGFEFDNRMPSLENQNSSKKKSFFDRERKQVPSKKLSNARYANSSEKSEGLMDRRKFLGLAGAAAAYMAAKPALEGAEKILKTIDVAMPEAEIDKTVENSPELMESERDETSYVPEDDLTDEELKRIKNLLDFDAPIRLDVEKYSLLERSWKNKYRDHVLYEREFEKAYLRMEEYKNELSAYFSQCGVPEEFVYLSIPESYAQSKALSHMKARGPYQFTKKTAIEYGLKVDGKTDERTDFIKSGKACARFLKKLFTELGDWTLALHAYNGGFSRRYASQARSKNETPSIEGFMEYMKKDIEAIRQKMKTAKHVEYEIVQGDTLLAIAKKYSVNYDELRRYNGVRDPRKIKIGQKILVPLSEKNREFVYNKTVAGRLENINYGPKCNGAFEKVREKQNIG